MTLLDIAFNARRRRYLVFHPAALPSPLRLTRTAATDAFEAVGSSRFYLSEDERLLAKVVPDKFDRRQAPAKWLLRDYLEKRWLGQSDARKEYLSLQILRRAGLDTPRCHGWGVSLAPGNRDASLLLMEHVQGAQPGGQYFVSLDKPAKETFLNRFCQEVLAVARAGFTHRDLHLNNLLVVDNGRFVWIDSHLKRLPRVKEKQWDAIAGSLTPSKLYGKDSRDYAHAWLKQAWH